MKMAPTYAICFVLLSVLFLMIGNISLNAQTLARVENNDDFVLHSNEPSSPLYEQESTSKKILRELQKTVNYPQLAVENCIEKRVVVHLSFPNASSRPTIEIYRDEPKIFQNEIQDAVNRIDFSSFLPKQNENTLEFYLPVVFKLR